MKYKKIVIGIDQSYKRTGISVVADGEIKKISYIDFKNCRCNSQKRNFLKWKLNKIISSLKPKAEKLIVIFERIRLKSQGFINIDYIKSIGALNAVIIDTCYRYDIPCYSVDTRAWKSAIVGTTKSKKNKYFVDSKKYPTIELIKKLGFEDKILIPVSDRVKKSFEKNGVRYQYNDDAADSACIALFGFAPDCDNKLKLEH